MKRKLSITILLIAFGCAGLGLFLYFSGNNEKNNDFTEYFTGYDDRISFIVEGYQMHWDGFSPEDLELSCIYSYESPYAGFTKYDLDGDGTEELLMGDQFEDGNYQIYDIFTFDRTTGDIIHLFCGGERNWCTVNGNGVIIETGSNSADDSFKNCYVLKKLKLKKLGKKQPVTLDLLVLDMDKFINYAQPQKEMPYGGYTGQHELSEDDMTLSRNVKGGPEMKVIIDNEGAVGRYVGENETSYQGETQDSYWIEKDKARTEIFRACDGQGILTLKNTGRKPVFRSPDTKSDVTGTMIYEPGYVPEVYNCLGYIKGWFLADVDGKTGFVQEELVNWDPINTF